MHGTISLKKLIVAVAIVELAAYEFGPKPV